MNKLNCFNVGKLNNKVDYTVKIPYFLGWLICIIPFMVIIYIEILFIILWYICKGICKGIYKGLYKLHKELSK